MKNRPDFPAVLDKELTGSERARGSQKKEKKILSAETMVTQGQL